MSQFNNGIFDLVIVGFVFYVVDRVYLMKMISEIDRVLKNYGFLIIKDFFAENPVKRKYQHISDFEAYSFKQNYDKIFTTTCLYNLLAKSTYDHHTRTSNAHLDIQNLVSVSLLRKDLDGNYK